WWRRLKRLDPRYLLPLAWWALIVVFFSIPDGKRDVYVMPALPMMCLALAPLLPGLLRRRAARWLLLGLAVLVAVLFLYGGAALRGPAGEHRRRLDAAGDRRVVPGLRARVPPPCAGRAVRRAGRVVGHLRPGRLRPAQRCQFRARGDDRGWRADRSGRGAGPGRPEGTGPADGRSPGRHFRFQAALGRAAAAGRGLAGAGAGALAAGTGGRAGAVHRPRADRAGR